MSRRTSPIEPLCGGSLAQHLARRSQASPNESEHPMSNPLLASSAITQPLRNPTYDSVRTECSFPIHSPRQETSLKAENSGFFSWPDILGPNNRARHRPSSIVVRRPGRLRVGRSQAIDTEEALRAENVEHRRQFEWGKRVVSCVSTHPSCRRKGLDEIRSRSETASSVVGRQASVRDPQLSWPGTYSDRDPHRSFVRGRS